MKRQVWGVAFCLWGGVGSVLLAGETEGRWSLSLEKSTGKNFAVLQTDSKRVLQKVPLDPVRVYSPVPFEKVQDLRARRWAARHGHAFSQLTAMDVSATPIEGGRFIVLQEQTVVLPPQLDLPAGSPAEFQNLSPREPEQNSVLVTLLDASGRPLWSRKYGPLVGRLPMDRKAWQGNASGPFEEILPSATSEEPKH